MLQFQDVIHFWFEELSPKDWFEKNLELDQKIQNCFLDTHAQAAHGELYMWRKAPEGRLAGSIVSIVMSVFQISN